MVNGSSCYDRFNRNSTHKPHKNITVNLRRLTDLHFFTDTKGNIMSTFYNVIEEAVRQKLRFDVGTQIVTTEDLYDIPMNTQHLSGDSLENAWRILNGQINAYKEESFTVDTSVFSNLVLAKKVVEYVIAVRQEETQKQFLQIIDEAELQKSLILRDLK